MISAAQCWAHRCYSFAHMSRSEGPRHWQALLQLAVVTLVLLAMTARRGAALRNGAALHPPMGWMSWQRYGCTRACRNASAKNCVNERLIRDTADAMVRGRRPLPGSENVCITCHA